MAVARAAAVALVVPLGLALTGSLAQVAEPTPVPYDAELQRLSEIMGALHFLDQLCTEIGSSPWRDEMSALLDAEQPDPNRRARMVDAFNRGYESYRSVYRTCEASAELAIRRYQDEGVRIAGDIGARYGEPDGK